MIAITTINSTKVNPAALRGLDVRVIILSFKTTQALRLHLQNGQATCKDNAKPSWPTLMSG
jgi:hypothetical protein